MRYESVITALIGARLGLAVGLILGVVTTVALKDEGFILSIPVGQLIVFVVLAVLAGVLAAFRPPGAPRGWTCWRRWRTSRRSASARLRYSHSAGSSDPRLACARMPSLITFEEALELGGADDHEDIERLVDVAWKVRQDGFGESTDMCSLVNAKSGGCAEDCGFCAQSKYADAETPMHAMMEPEQILEHARAAEAAGAHRFCMVTQGQGLSKRDFAKVLEGARLVAEHTNLKRCASIGHMSRRARAGS